jgi:hypothetical protein
LLDQARDQPKQKQEMPCHINRRSLVFIFFSQSSEDNAASRIRLQPTCQIVF